MAFIKEEIEHEVLGAKISVFERELGEIATYWQIIVLEVDSFEQCSPKQLRELGKWLIEQGKRIGKEYKSNGARRTNQVPAGTAIEF